MSMFRVTPVPESSKERKVSFSPDIDESYRHEVVGKIKNLMEEVSVSLFLPSPLLDFFLPFYRNFSVQHSDWWQHVGWATL